MRFIKRILNALNFTSKDRDTDVYNFNDRLHLYEIRETQRERKRGL